MKNNEWFTKFILVLLSFINLNLLYSQSVADLYSSGIKALERSDPAKALGIFDEVLKQRPYYYDAYAGKAEALYQMGKEEEAMQHIARALEMKPDHSEALFLRSQILLRQGKSKQALQDLEKSTASQIILPKAWIAKAQLLKEMGRRKDALTTLNELITRKSSQTPVDAFILRAQVNKSLGFTKEALEDLTYALSLPSPPDTLYLERTYLRISLRDTAAAIEDLTRFILLNPSHAPSRTLRAELFHKKAEFAGAYSDLNHLIDGMKIRNDASLYIARAAASRALERYEDAVQDLSRAMIYDRDNAAIILERAEIYGIQGKETAALADFRRLMRMEVKDYRPWLGRAKYYFSKEKYELAIQDLNESIRIQPNGEAFFLRGACYDLLGDRKRACDDLKKAAASGHEAAAIKITSYCK